MRSDFLHHRIRRSPRAWLALGLGLATLALASQISAPPILWYLLAPCLAISVLQIARTPHYGLRFSARFLHVADGERDISLPLSRIAYLNVGRLGESDIRVVLKNGERITLPRESLPDPHLLIRESTDRGVPIRQK